MLRCLLAVMALLSATILMAEPSVAPVYQGFSIDPPSGWIVWEKRQKPNHAIWGKIDKAYIRHTILADVQISPPDVAKMSISDLQSKIEQSLKQQPPARIKDFQFEITQGSRRGTPTLEVRTQATDTGFAPTAKLFSRSFTLITPDKRLLTVTVSERSDQVDFKFDEQEAEKFFDAVSW